MSINGGDFIGRGGYGCVFSPALSFQKKELIECSSIIERFECPLVTKANETQYVSKIGTNVKKEFELAKAIVERLREHNIDAFDLEETPGFFPSQYIKVSKQVLLDNYEDEYFDMYHGKC